MRVVLGLGAASTLLAWKCSSARAMSASLLNVPHVLNYGARINFCLIPLMGCIPASLAQWVRQHRRDAQEKHETDRREHAESPSNPVEFRWEN